MKAELTLIKACACVITARCPQIMLKTNQEPQAIAGPTPLPRLVITNLTHMSSDT